MDRLQHLIKVHMKRYVCGCLVPVRLTCMGWISKPHILKLWQRTFPDTWMWIHQKRRLRLRNYHLLLPSPAKCHGTFESSTVSMWVTGMLNLPAWKCWFVIKNQWFGSCVQVFPDITSWWNLGQNWGDSLWTVFYRL